MSLDVESQKQVLTGLIDQAEKEKYQSVTMAEVWGAVGNAEREKQCAEAAGNVSMVIAKLREKLAALTA